MDAALAPRSRALARDYRANPAYELVLFDRLGEDEREALGELRLQPDFYGVLRPEKSGGAPAPAAPPFPAVQAAGAARATPATQPGAGGRLGLRAVDRETALLFLTLRETGPLPSYLTSLLGEEAVATVARLVADGVLEVEHAGSYLSGAGALGLVGFPASAARGPAGPEGGTGPGRLAALSEAALRYGQELACLARDVQARRAGRQGTEAREAASPLALSFRLYGYNRLPLTPRWRRRLAGRHQVEDFLGLTAGAPTRRALERWWRQAAPAAGWMSWHALPGRNAGGRLGPDETGSTYKLYLSPATEALPALLAPAAEALATSGANSFKVGSDAWGLLRPDKLVAHFPRFESLAAAAERLCSQLDGTPAQGVPFTAEIGGSGLLSWGIDPPAGERSTPGGGRESWRLWLTHRLASALLDACAHAAGRDPLAPATEPWRLALERLGLEGIDTSTWTPRGPAFQRAEPAPGAVRQG